MGKRRIQVYADEETKRRVELAAAKHHMAVTEYCLSAIRQQLADDDMLERDKVEIAVYTSSRQESYLHLGGLRETILADRRATD